MRRFEVDPQLGPGAVEFFNSVTEGTQEVCFEVIALREPDPKIGRYLLDYNISSTTPPQGNYQPALEAIRDIWIDQREKSKFAPANNIGGVTTIDPGKHTFSFTISPRAKVRLAMAMRKREDEKLTFLNSLEVLEVRNCEER